MDKTLCSPNSHNLDVTHLGLCIVCGGTKLTQAERPLPPPVAEESEDLFKVAMDNDWSAKKIIAYILENYTLAKK